MASGMTRFRKAGGSYPSAQSACGSGRNAAQQMGAELNLSSPLVEYHLSMLEKALVIQRHEAGWRVTSTGLLFLEKVEGGP
ncbi:MAG: hypothetical protein CG437_1602 [Methanosaeta sp. NSP1]|nr:MAG: hypothetical protein CG437_1602 [Methanosaeta sp. NSP1]